MIDSTAHPACNILADLLIANGVKDVIISPGNRNVPLVMALVRRGEEGLRCHPVIDERSAAFIGLGLSKQTDRPVAIVCTSGTALLNYAPAVAEAFYSRVPLIVVSADRPEEWIDQDDSQTLWQQNALSGFVKRAVDIPAHLGFDNGPWWARRMISDALAQALAGPRGPVHINVRIDTPLNSSATWMEGSTPSISTLAPKAHLPVSEMRRLGKPLRSPHKVMVIAGFHEPDARLNRALARMASLPNVVVLTETVSNLHSPLFISRIDSTLSTLSDDERQQLIPDTVITVGGALVSGKLKAWIRSLSETEHWYVGEGDRTVDCFRHLSMRIDMSPSIFMSQLASALSAYPGDGGELTLCDYARIWRSASQRAARIHSERIALAPWSTLKAFSILIPSIPRTANLHLSNGTSVRYAQLMDCSNFHRCECNRGVSGIDGSTSTALGASVGYRAGLTVLISGDMSFQYDIAALSSTLINNRLRMIVICNDGGEIFRFLGSTSRLPELERYLAGGTRLPLRDLCHGYGIEYSEASSEVQLREALEDFYSPCINARLLAVQTSGTDSAAALRDYFKR